MPNWAQHMWNILRLARASTSSEQLQKGRWLCGSCDQEHRWPFDLAAHAPDPWPHVPEYEPNGALRMDGDFLSEDFCVLNGEHFFVRCILTIPVQGMCDDFGFGCWSTLSRQNFEKYIEGFDSIHPSQEELWSGWLCNRLADFDGNEAIGVWVQLRPGRKRPLLWVMDDDYPLAVAQEHGISADRMMEIFAYYGHAPIAG
ncbi:DUF2199 domain-containing protein [Sphingobium sp. 3R8]|nr:MULTISPECIES: DUF2199 domain-containing protein [Sphingomonadaceae]MBZ9648240.1 DUF2199 domain-containing protein [Sphingobium sp. 3R8]